MVASYTSMLLVVLVASLIPVKLHVAGFSLPLIAKHDGFTYRSDGFLGYIPATKPTGGETKNLMAIRPPMASYGWSYAVQVGIGTGPGRQFYMLQLDLTGVLTWMQCEPSLPDLPQASPIFDSSMSPGYVNVAARSHICKAPYTPAGQDRCSFQASFHGASAHGYLGNDTFTFASSSSGVQIIPRMVFGCAHTTEGFQNHGALAGVLSMSRHRTSMIKQLSLSAQLFSYCLSFAGNRQGFLRFWDDVHYPPNMRSTGIMFTTNPSAIPAYHIRVTGVFLNGQELGIAANAFRRGGCRIDVGKPMSRMIQAAYGVLDHAVAAHLARYGAQRFAVQGYNLCVLDTPVIRAHLPSMALQLYEGAFLDIAPAQLFVVVSDQGNQYLCFTVVPDEHQTVLGAMQQVNTQFVFDIPNNKISFAPAQC